jgi:hypothetical protein
MKNLRLVSARTERINSQASRIIHRVHDFTLLVTVVTGVGENVIKIYVSKLFPISGIWRRVDRYTSTSALKAPTASIFGAV